MPDNIGHQYYRPIQDFKYQCWFQKNGIDLYFEVPTILHE